MKLKKKNSLIKLALTERLYNSLGILFFIVVVFPLAFLCLAGLVYVVAHIPRWIFKYAFLILFSGAVSFCVVATAIKMKRMFVGLWLSSKLPLSKNEFEELNISTLKEYLMFLDKYIGNNKLYMSSEHLAFISEIHYCGPMFLIAESSICLESKHYWHKLNKNRFALYDLEENLEEYDRYGVETRSWQKTGVVLAINNAAVHKDVRKDRLFSVWGKPEYDNSFEFNVAQDSCSAYLREIKGKIVHKENIGRRV